MGLQLCKSQWAVNQKINMYKLAILCVAIVGAFAAPNAEADADAYYGYHYPALYNAYPNWPGVSTPYSSSTCFGCRGKRSAEPGYIGYGPYFGGYHYGPGIAAHPGYATSYVARSPQGLGKRSADAEADAAYVGHGFPHGSAAYAAYPVHHAP